MKMGFWISVIQWALLLNLKHWFIDLKNTHQVHVVLVEIVTDHSEEKLVVQKYLV